MRSYDFLGTMLAAAFKLLPLLHSVASLTAGRWTVNITDVGNIASVLSDGADMKLDGPGVCPGMAHSPEALRGMNAPSLIDARTGQVHACALATRCNAPADSKDRRSFCYDFGTTFGDSSHVRVFYNVTLLPSLQGDDGFSLLQDVALDVSGSDENMVLVLQLPVPVQPNKLAEKAHFVESRTHAGMPSLSQVTGEGVSSPWRGEFAMSESAFSTVSKNDTIYNSTVNYLALPLVVTWAPGDKLRAAHVADPYYSTGFEYAGDGHGSACWRSVYNSSKSSLNGSRAVKVTRRFGTIVHSAREGWNDEIDVWYNAVLPQIRAPPEWTRSIALSHFDYYTRNGSSWRAEVDWMSERLSPEERGRVVMAQEGWYDTQGDYSFDAERGSFVDSWIFGPGSPFWVPSTNGSEGHWNCSYTSNSCDQDGNPKIWAVNMTVDKVRGDLHYARSHGFRVLLYFADGLLVCKKAKSYDPARVLPDSLFSYMATHMADCPCPADQKFCNSVLNPADPKVYAWYIKYMKGLLKTFGDVIDGFVWDETFYVTPSSDMVDAAGGYAATAMLRLVEHLTAMVYDYNPEMIFMASDIPSGSQSGQPYVATSNVAPTYGVVASGQFPDFEVNAQVWPALHATIGKRAAVWSCNWDPVNHLPATEAATYTYGLPPSLGMCYHTSQFPNVGISGMQSQDSETILRLFNYIAKQGSNISAVYV